MCRAYSPEIQGDTEGVLPADRRIRAVLLVAGAAAIFGVVRGILWAMPDRRRFRASSGA